MKSDFFTNELIKKRLMDMSEGEYRKFSGSLIPGCNNMLGCRIPYLRSLAKEICKTDFRKYLENATEDYFEEIMLQGFVIGYAKMEIQERLVYVEKFIPKIDNWSLNDGFCSTFKVKEEDRECVFEFLLPYAKSSKEFEVRVAAVMFMNNFFTENYIDRVLEMFFEMKQDEYYAMMGIAWALATAYAKFPIQTKRALEWDWPGETLNKAIQKMCESYRIDECEKSELRKRKK